MSDIEISRKCKCLFPNLQEFGGFLTGQDRQTVQIDPPYIMRDMTA